MRHKEGHKEGHKEDTRKDTHLVVEVAAVVTHAEPLAFLVLHLDELRVRARHISHVMMVVFKATSETHRGAWVQVGGKVVKEWVNDTVSACQTSSPVALTLHAWSCWVRALRCGCVSGVHNLQAQLIGTETSFSGFTPGWPTG